MEWTDNTPDWIVPAGKDLETHCSRPGKVNQWLECRPKTAVLQRVDQCRFRDIVSQL